MQLIEVSRTQADLRHPGLAALVSSGSAFALADSKGPQPSDAATDASAFAAAAHLGQLDQRL